MSLECHCPMLLLEMKMDMKVVAMLELLASPTTEAYMC